jgi:hypothetical protein
MALTEEDKRTAAEMVLRDWRIKPFVKRDPERVKRIAEVTWAACEEYDKAQGLTREYNDFELVRLFALARLEKREDYQEMVSFIPAWLVAIVVKLIVSILIDFWLVHERGR